MDRLDLLRLFVTIAERGSLAAAGRALGIAPSTVTMALRRLEDQAGTRLVLRTTRRLSLSPDGERFLQRARNLLADVESAFDDLSSAGAISGTIRITATNDFGRTVLAPLIDSFLARHPKVRVSVLLTDAIQDLVEGGFDLAIRTGPLTDPALPVRLLLMGPRVVCAAPAYWRRMGTPGHPRDLERHNCLILARPGAPQSIWTFRTDGHDLPVRVSGDRDANDGAVLRQWAIGGAGVILKLRSDVAADLAAGRLESALDAFSTGLINLYAVFPSRERVPPRVQAFVDHLAAGLAPGGI